MSRDIHFYELRRHPVLRGVVQAPGPVGTRHARGKHRIFRGLPPRPDPCGSQEPRFRDVRGIGPGGFHTARALSDGALIYFQAPKPPYLAVPHHVR